VKDKDIESEAKTAQSVVKLEELVTSKAMRREYLENLVIRPNLIGKKTIGNLEIHQNGPLQVAQRSIRRHLLLQREALLLPSVCRRRADRYSAFQPAPRNYARKQKGE